MLNILEAKHFSISWYPDYCDTASQSSLRESRLFSERGYKKCKMKWNAFHKFQVLKLLIQSMASREETFRCSFVLTIPSSNSAIPFECLRKVFSTVACSLSVHLFRYWGRPRSDLWSFALSVRQVQRLSGFTPHGSSAPTHWQPPHQLGVVGERTGRVKVRKIMGWDKKQLNKCSKSCVHKQSKARDSSTTLYGWAASQSSPGKQGCGNRDKHWT